MPIMIMMTTTTTRLTWKRILMKMRLAEDVSSSPRRMYSKHVHGRASVCSRWAKNLATLRSLFVSRRWIVAYCVAKACSSGSGGGAAAGEERRQS